MVIQCIEMKKIKKEEMEGKWKKMKNSKSIVKTSYIKHQVKNQNLHKIISYNPDPHINAF
jgi:phage tail tube protein FII